jgi:penicillin-binding protein 1A
LGRRSFGVQAAARAYFDKDVDQLSLTEMSYLAILPKAPETYSRAKFADRALERRNFVLDQMAANEFVTPHRRTRPRAVRWADPGTSAGTVGGCGLLLRNRAP